MNPAVRGPIAFGGKLFASGIVEESPCCWGTVRTVKLFDLHQIEDIVVSRGRESSPR